MSQQQEQQENQSYYRDLVEGSLKPLDLIGLNPLKPMGRIRANLVALILIINLYLIYLLWRNATDYGIYGDLLETTNFFTVVVIKFSTVYFNRKSFKKIVDGFGKFWIPKETALNEIGTLQKLLKFYLFILKGTGVFYVLKSLLVNKLTYAVYQPEFCPKIAMQIYTNFSYVICMIILVSIDPFFFNVLVILTTQFRKINSILQNLDFRPLKVQNSHAQLRSCVAYFNHLLSVLENINEANGLFLFFHIFITEFLICAELLLNRIDFDLVRIVTAFGVCGCCVGCFVMMYAWPADSIAEQVDQISMSCYNSNWYECEETSVRKDLIILMNGAKRDCAVMGWKFIQITLATTTQIFKSVMSFYGFVSTMM